MNLKEIFKPEMLEEGTTSRSVIDSMFIPVSFPEVQKFMEEEWFGAEAILINDEVGLNLYGPSAYFIPVNKLL